MPSDPTFIFDRTINPDYIIAVRPYITPHDPSNEVYDDLNSTVLLTRRPHQLAARRDPKLLSQHLGFHYLPIDNVALNPLYQISVELVSAGDKLLERYPQGRTKVTLSRSGLKRILFVKTDPDQLNDILASTPQRCPIFDLIKRSRANARSTPSAG